MAYEIGDVVEVESYQRARHYLLILGTPSQTEGRYYVLDLDLVPSDDKTSFVLRDISKDLCHNFFII